MQPDLRLQERLLLDPPIDCLFGSSRVVVGDLSGIGARLRHDSRIEPGSKAPLHLAPGVSCDGEIVWCLPSISAYAFESGVRLYTEPQKIGPFLERLVDDGRTSRVDERRQSSRYVLIGAQSGLLDGPDVRVRIVDLSSKGVRVISTAKLVPGEKMRLIFSPGDGNLVVDLNAEVIWCRLQSIWGEQENYYDAGICVLEMPGLMRAAIGVLTEQGACMKDTRSLIVKSRLESLSPAEEIAAESLDSESGGRISLVRRVRSKLDSDPVEKNRWLSQADVASNHPMIRGLAGPIRDNREALAVWEYLDRTVDPSLVVLGWDE